MIRDIGLRTLADAAGAQQPPDTKTKRDQPEHADSLTGQSEQSRAHSDTHANEHREAKVLPEDDLPGVEALVATSEQHRQHDHVVNIRRRERSSRCDDNLDHAEKP